MLFKDRLEVWNPGTLPQGLTLDSLKGVHNSIPANPIVALPAYLAGYIERLGTGTTEILKANLFQYVIPKANLLKGSQKNDIIKDLQIEREEGAYQFEFSYVKPEYRGCGIKQKLNSTYIGRAIEKSATKVQTHVFQSNEKSIKANLKSGFKIIKSFKSDNPGIKYFYPDNAMVLMEKEL